METVRTLFSLFFNMSLTAAIVILFVMFVRFLLRRAPKIFSYLLWLVVLLRLLCPVSFSFARGFTCRPRLGKRSGSTSCSMSRRTFAGVTTFSGCLHFLHCCCTGLTHWCGVHFSYQDVTWKCPAMRRSCGKWGRTCVLPIRKHS